MTKMDEGSSSMDSKIRRRSVLAKIGAGAVAGLIGATGQSVAASEIEADQEARDLYESYSSKESYVEAVQTHASGVVDELHSRGDISTTDVSEIVEDPTESEKTDTLVVPNGDSWRALLRIEANESVTIQVEPSEKRSHGKVSKEDGPQIITSDNLQSGSESDDSVGTMDHETADCYANYETCYGGIAGGGDTICYIYEVYDCPSGCVEHRTGNTCQDCSINDPSPC